MIFRDYTPVRRNIIRAVSSHKNHRADLKLDFKSRCGYCNSPDHWKITYYEIDHFIPEKILTIKAKTDYSNLVYSCRSCNNAKRKQWPTNNENIPNANNEGFIDPCDNSYNNQFERKDSGEIGYLTDLGKWIYFAIKLHKPQHKIIWYLEQLELMIVEIETLSIILNDNIEIKDLLISTYQEYRKYVNEFRLL